MNYKVETKGVPLFTSLTLNINRIEVEYRGFKCLEAKEERNERIMSSAAFRDSKMGYLSGEDGPPYL